MDEYLLRHGVFGVVADDEMKIGLTVEPQGLLEKGGVVVGLPSTEATVCALFSGKAEFQR